MRPFSLSFSLNSSNSSMCCRRNFSSSLEIPGSHLGGDSILSGGISISVRALGELSVQLRPKVDVGELVWDGKGKERKVLHPWLPLIGHNTS